MLKLLCFLIIYFNSIKVRLKRELLPCFVQEVNPFQFHKGTIKTKHKIYYTYVRKTFQFHKGTIKTLRSARLCGLSPNFNSIKVRLKLRFSNLPLDYFTFQFHKGTIKTR